MLSDAVKANDTMQNQYAPFKHLVRRQRVGVGRAHAGGVEFSAHFVGRLAFHQRFGLREKVGKKNRVLIVGQISVVRLRRRQKVARNELATLMNQLNTNHHA